MEIVIVLSSVSADYYHAKRGVKRGVKRDEQRGKKTEAKQGENNE
jgi:hypothetical protein